MTNLRQEVIDADKDGETETRDAKLAELRKFVFSHIIVNIKEDNGVSELVFGTGTFYLEGSYSRDAQAAIEAAKATIDSNSGTNPNGNVYKKAADVCDALARQNGWAYSDTRYIGCYQTEIAKYQTDEILTDITVDIPSAENYRVEYSSPVWYPCLSGLFVLITLILAVVVIVRTLIWLALHVAVFVLDHSK